MIMKHTLYLLIAVLISILSVSCSEERLAGSVSSSEFEEGELVLASLHLSVNGFEVNVQSGSRAPEDEPTQEELVGTDEENAIHNIWVFQFNTNGDQLINPRYYEIADQAELQDLKVWLKPGVASTVYVVANTGQPDWIKENTDVSTLTKLESLDLFNLDPQFINEGKPLSLPMEGKEDNVTVSEVSGAPENSVTVHVTRMFAKLQVKVSITPANIKLRNIAINRIPLVSKIKERTGEGDDKTNYNGDRGYWYDDFFDESDDESKTYVMYMAENMQGRIDNNSEKDEENAPANAFEIGVNVNHTSVDDGSTTYPTYKVYPGQNMTNDFNIKRNCIYNITVNIEHDEKVNVPSSNCFIVIPGRLLAFEPYYRTETGGGFRIEDYLNPDEESKAIDRVSILWQTENAIGDNTNGDLVYYDSGQKKIYVRTQEGNEGNALIAAYNKAGEIIWSWHIWVTGNDPANLTNSIRYTTYRWDEKGIYTEEQRVPGYQVMSCNLGALANKPANATDTKPFGLLYQWGRKDPFPPVENGNGITEYAYDKAVRRMYYDNTNREIVGITSDIYGADDTSGNNLFYSVMGNALSPQDPLIYAIQHPTVFICGTAEGRHYTESDLQSEGSYANNGDWNYKSNDELWGGKTPDNSGNMKKLNIGTATIYNNYEGTDKSIFDPCPYGWRVPPGDFWLGFTKTGMNPTTWEEINVYELAGWSKNWWGTYIYLTDWKNGKYTYFPNQGTRVSSGYGIRVGQCGNYHNATTDDDNRVNILHIHNDSDLFHIFETSFRFYYVKSVAGPIRCVRESQQ